MTETLEDGWTFPHHKQKFKEDIPSGESSLKKDKEGKTGDVWRQLALQCEQSKQGCGTSMRRVWNPMSGNPDVSQHP